MNRDKLDNHLKPELEKIKAEMLFTDGYDYKYKINCRPLSIEHVNKIKNNLFENDLLDKVPVVMWFSEFEHYKIVEGQHAVEAKRKECWDCKVVDGDGSTNETLCELAYDYSAKEGQTIEQSRFVQECDACHILHARYMREQERKGSKSTKGVIKYIQSILGSLSDDKVDRRLNFYKKIESASNDYEEEYEEIRGEKPIVSLLEECVSLNLTQAQANKYLDEKKKEFWGDIDYDYVPSTNYDSQKDTDESKKELTDEDIEMNTTYIESDPKFAKVEISLETLNDYKSEIEEKDRVIKHLEDQLKNIESQMEELNKVLFDMNSSLEKLKSDKSRIKRKYLKAIGNVKKKKTESLLAE